jgi:Domain of unknown function (DUF4175)
MQHYETIRQLIDRVRRRWRTQQAFEAIARASLAAILVVGIALTAALGTAGKPGALATIGIAAVVLTLAVVVWGLLPLRRVPGDRQVARFIEERAPELDDRLVSAVDVATGQRSTPLAGPMLADAARRASDVDATGVIPSSTLRRAGLQAATVILVLVGILFVGREPARQALDAGSLKLFPGRLTLEVTPGNARIKAGTTLDIQARLVGNKAPVIALMQIADGDRWRGAEMATAKPGTFHLTTEPIGASFKYRVVAGTVTSPTYDVLVARPPRVTRIDVDYTYPAGLNLKPRTERDAGDIYAPAGTDVRVHIFTDLPAATGQMALANGKSIALSADQPTELTASLKVLDDNSYRVALADAEGMSNAGETEYFIRTLEDRPPEVRILKPATDRSVTRLEEVDVEAQAEDDYGIDRLELVYSVRGGAEKAVPLPIPKQSTSANGRHTLFLEDLDVKPGDFISYHVRARDLTRGTRPNEARSDIFFLDVKPYEQEFALAQSSSMAGQGASGNIDDLVAAQKEIVVATWKLDRRAQNAKGARSEQDIRSVAKAENELKARVEQTSSSFRESTMRDPRRRPGQGSQGSQGGRGGPPAPRAGETLPEEDHMTAAAAAMGKAAESLEALKTGPALPPEMEALNHLLQAQADVKKREVTRQQAGSGAGNNRSNYDMSALFDKELQKAQQTNYENRSTTEQHADRNQSELDKIRDLARRQDELLKRQADLAKKRESMTDEELKRELDTLTREQSDLRQRAEDLARQMNQSGQQSQQAEPEKSGGQRGQSQSGQQGKAGQSGQTGESGNSGQSGQSTGQMRDVSEAMRNATNDLRRQNPSQASASGARALEKLREMERQLQSRRPDEQRRALGDMQLEARQLADAQRQIASELAKTGQSDTAKEAVRRLAGEQERLADRARGLQESLERQAGGGNRAAATDKDRAQTQAAAGEAARELQRQRTAERMQQSADAMRAAADRGQATQRGTTAAGAESGETRTQASTQEAMARELDRVADRLAAGTGAKDGESKKLSDQLARVQQQRDALDRISRELGQTGQQNGAAASQGRSAQKTPGQSGKVGEGQQGGGGGSGTDLAKLREQSMRQLQQTRELLNQLAREDQTFSHGGAGLTFEGRGMTMSAPGTEAFKQDFARWEEMKRQMTTALDLAETSISKKLQAKQARDRLAAGADDKAPPEYRQQVDSYFKAIAGKKKP